MADAKRAPTEAKKGRPLVGKRPMTSVERTRRSRTNRKMQAGAQQLDEHRKWKRDWDSLSDKEKSARVLADLCLSRNLRSDTDKVLAMKAVSALSANNAALYVKLVELLPPARSVEASTHGTSTLKERFLQAVMNAVAADQQELASRAERGELSEHDRLQLQINQIDQQALGLPDADKPAAVEPVQPTERERVLLAEIERLRAKCGEAPPPPPPPSDHAANPRRLTPADDWNTKPVTVLDIKPTVLDTRAEPEKPPEPAPSPQTPGQWDQSDNAAKWRAWRDAGNDIFY
jgi:hypothetical protein